MRTISHLLRTTFSPRQLPTPITTKTISTSLNPLSRSSHQIGSHMNLLARLQFNCCLDLCTGREIPRWKDLITEARGPRPEPNSSMEALRFTDRRISISGSPQYTLSSQIPFNTGSTLTATNTDCSDNYNRIR